MSKKWREWIWGKDICLPGPEVGRRDSLPNRMQAVPVCYVIRGVPAGGRGPPAQKKMCGIGRWNTSRYDEGKEKGRQVLKIKSGAQIGEIRTMGRAGRGCGRW